MPLIQSSTDQRPCYKAERLRCCAQAGNFSLQGLRRGLGSARGKGRNQTGYGNTV